MIWECAAAVVLIGVLLKLLGCFDATEVTIAEKPEIFAGGITVYYKHHIGSYGSAYKLVRELMELVPDRAGRSFGIYYDDPKKVPAHLLQSAIGVIVQTGDRVLVQPIIIEQLQRRGLEKMVIPAIDRSVTASREISTMAMFMPATLNPLVQLYAAIADYVKAHSLSTTVAFETYTLDSSRYTVHFPLDHQDEFIVHEKISTEALQTKLACAKFDSDESSSESEASGDELIDEEDAEASAGGDQ